MTRTGAAASSWAHDRAGPGRYPPTGMPDSGLCLQFTRQCFDVPSYYASAIDAWNANPEQHPGDRHPPPAVPVWFWSSSPYRHVAFWDGHAVVSTYNDDVWVYPSLSAAEAVFGGYMGWSPQVNRVTVYTPPPSQEDDMTPEESNTLHHIAALLDETPRRTAEQVHYWQVSRVAGAPTTFLQDQTDGVTNTYTLVGDATASTARRWSPAQLIALMLAVAVVVLVVLAPWVLKIDDTAAPYLGIVGVLASAVATLVATTRGGHGRHTTRHVPTSPPPAEPIDPDNDPARDIRRQPQDLEYRD